jgi:hypothetical protein
MTDKDYTEDAAQRQGAGRRTGGRHPPPAGEIQT